MKADIIRPVSPSQMSPTQQAARRIEIIAKYKNIDPFDAMPGLKGMQVTRGDLGLTLAGTFHLKFSAERVREPLDKNMVNLGKDWLELSRIIDVVSNFATTSDVSHKGCTITVDEGKSYDIRPKAGDKPFRIYTINYKVFGHCRALDVNQMLPPYEGRGIAVISISPDADQYAYRIANFLTMTGNTRVSVAPYSEKTHERGSAKNASAEKAVVTIAQLEKKLHEANTAVAAAETKSAETQNKLTGARITEVQRFDHVLKVLKTSIEKRTLADIVQLAGQIEKFLETVKPKDGK